MSEERQWSGKTDGSLWMHKALIGCFKILPMGLVYFFMALVVPFYMLINHQGYLAIYHYLRQRQGRGPLQAFLGCYRNHFLFGASLMDRFAAYAGRKFKVKKTGYDVFNSLVENEQGFIMLSSHIGNAEMSGYMLSTPLKRMNAITFPEEKASVRSNRDRMLEANNIRLISADGLDWLFTLNAALSDGEIVSMHADRLFGSSKALKVTILGAEAQIPMGPFNLGASRGLPVTASFCMKTGYRSYEAIQYRLDTPEMDTMTKKEKMEYLAARYAAVVNEVLKKWPLQWYNFFEFWD